MAWRGASRFARRRPFVLTRYLIPIACLALSAFALSACGGGGSEQAQVEEVIETSIFNSDPANCRELSTPAFVEQLEHQEGEAAFEACEEDASDTSNNPDSIDISEVEVDGSTATANVAFTGSAFDGQAVSVVLVKEDGQWKMDELTAFTEFDRQKLLERFEADLTTPPDALSEAPAGCFVDQLDALTDAEIETLLLSKSPTRLEALLGACT